MLGLYLKQGCINNRGYTAVHVEALNEYQSHFFSFPSSANVDVQGRINDFFVCNLFFEEFCKFMCFKGYIHNVPRMKIIIEE